MHKVRGSKWPTMDTVRVRSVPNTYLNPCYLALGFETVVRPQYSLKPRRLPSSCREARSHFQAQHHKILWLPRFGVSGKQVLGRLTIWSRHQRSELPSVRSAKVAGILYMYFLRDRPKRTRDCGVMWRRYHQIANRHPIFPTYFFTYDIHVNKVRRSAMTQAARC